MSIFSPHVVQYLLSRVLTPSELLLLSGTCQTLRRILSDQRFWFRTYLRLWPQCTHPYVDPHPAPAFQQANLDQDVETWTLEMTEDDACVDWRMATCLRYGLVERNTKRFRSSLNALLVGNDTDLSEDLILAQRLKALVEEQIPVLQFESTVKSTRAKLKSHKIDVGLVALRYRNRSDGGIRLFSFRLCSCFFGLKFCCQAVCAMFISTAQSLFFSLRARTH
jgi:hypothetical protein